MVLLSLLLEQSFWGAGWGRGPASIDVVDELSVPQLEKMVVSLELGEPVRSTSIPGAGAGDDCRDDCC